jgi:histidinol-phosphatase (PHP family)
VGHFDLLTKFNDCGRVFDESDKRYQTCALDALDFLLEKDLIFEINTGAISRGYRKTPYPAEFLLKRVAENGGRVVINSDCHNAYSILSNFPEAVQYASACGIKALTIIKNGKFTEIKI